MTKLVTDKELHDALGAYESNGSNAAAAARQLGIPRATLQSRLRSATVRGIGSSVGGPLPVGLGLHDTSIFYGPDGDLKGQWVKARVERSLEDTVTLIKEAFDEQRPAPRLPAADRRRVNGTMDVDLLTVYPIVDLHLGMYSWDEETGENYDVKLAAELLRNAMGKLVSMAPPSEHALILNLGDFFHSDSDENRTHRSNNSLDVDTRYARVLRTGVGLLADSVALARQRHRIVIVKTLPGNHDPYGALALSVGVAAYFRNDPNVLVDTSPNRFFYHRFGKVLIGATHGDMAKLEDMPGIMAAQKAEDWGETEFRYIYGGHWHTNKKALPSSKSGAQVEVFETLAAKDSWNKGMGFLSGRSAVAITHHRNEGEKYRQTHTVRGPR